MPLFHVPAVAWATRGTRGPGDRVSSGYSTPVLLMTDGRALRDSKDIVHMACAASGEDLYPCAEVEAMETRLHDRLGPHARRVTYFHLFRHPPLLRVLARRNVGRTEAGAFAAMLPILTPMLKRALGVTESNATRSLEVTRQEFDWVGEVLGDKRYLLGDTFSAADLMFAAMAAAVLIPTPDEGYGANLFFRDELPDDVRELSQSLRDTAAGQHALRMYAEERGQRLVPCPPTVTRADQTRNEPEETL